MGDPLKMVKNPKSTTMDEDGGIPWYPHDLGKPPFGNLQLNKENQGSGEQWGRDEIYPDIWFLRPTSWARVQVSAFTAAPREIRSSRSDFCSACRWKKMGCPRGKREMPRGNIWNQNGKKNWKTMENIWTHMNNLSIRNWDCVVISHNFNPYLTIVNNMYSLVGDFIAKDEFIHGSW